MKLMHKGGAYLIIMGLLLPCLVIYGQAAVPDSSAEAYEVIASGLGSIMANDVAHARDDAIERFDQTGAFFRNALIGGVYSKSISKFGRRRGGHGSGLPIFRYNFGNIGSGQGDHRL